MSLSAGSTADAPLSDMGLHDTSFLGKIPVSINLLWTLWSEILHGQGICVIVADQF